MRFLEIDFVCNTNSNVFSSSSLVKTRQDLSLLNGNISKQEEKTRPVRDRRASSITERAQERACGFMMMANRQIRRPREDSPIETMNDFEGIVSSSKFDDWPVIEVRSQNNMRELKDNFPRSHRRQQCRSTIKLAARNSPRHLTSRLTQAKCSSLVAILLVIYTASSIPDQLLSRNVSASESVDCFKCSSRNGTNPACEDPFHNTNTTRVQSPTLPEPHPNVIYHTPCYAGKKGRDGLFPASACIKLTGTFARMSHCGKFQFEGDLLRGCVLACPEDACNSATRLDSYGMLPFITCLSVSLSLNSVLAQIRSWRTVSI